MKKIIQAIVKAICPTAKRDGERVSLKRALEMVGKIGTGDKSHETRDM